MWNNIGIPDQVIDQNIPHFRESEQKIKASGKTFAPSWNWAAFFFNIYWLIYRRCYKWAAIAYGGMVVASGVLTGITGILGVLMPIIIMVVSGLFGDSLYFYGIKEKIYKMKQAGSSDSEILDKTRPSWKPVIIVAAIALGIGILTGILIALLGAAIFAGFGSAMQY